MRVVSNNLESQLDPEVFFFNQSSIGTDQPPNAHLQVFIWVGSYGGGSALSSRASGSFRSGLSVAANKGTPSIDMATKGRNFRIPYPASLFI